MSVESYRESPGKFDSRTLSRETLSRWTGRIQIQTARLTRRALRGWSGRRQPRREREGMIDICVYVYAC